MVNKVNKSIRAFVFDAYGTLFDVYSVVKKCNDMFPDKGDELSVIWREKQVEYSFLRQLMGKYATFFEITKEALQYACEKVGVELSKEHEEELLNDYLKLDVFPEVKEVLQQLQENKCKVAIFSNGSSDMLDPLVKHAQLDKLIPHVISVDAIKQYKPTPASYNLVLEELGVKREEVLFMSSNTWDIAGATSFGFNTVRINRKSVIMDKLGVQPNYTYTDLKGILEHL